MQASDFPEITGGPPLAPLANEPRLGGGRRIALLLPTLGGGGAEASMLRTGEALRNRGFEVDLVLCERTGPLVAQVPTGIRMVELAPAPMLLARAYALAADPGGFRELLRPVLLARKAPHRLVYLPALVRYLRRVRPDALFAALPGPSLMAVWARRLARVTTRVTVSQRNALSQTLAGSSKWRKRFLPPLLRRTYLAADAIVAVSDGVGSDLATCTGIPRARITTIYNPVVTPDLFAKAREALEHPWLAGASPIVLGVGALIDQKDFPTLVRAFARVRAARPCRLIILGRGKNPEQTTERQARLMALAEELGVACDVLLPGFVSNPLAYMARAALFVLSSRYEGLPGVLIQALACGCPVVSTDCPHGPAEILDGGRYGRLVPVGDAAALAAAMLATLASPPPADWLKERAALFSVDRAVDRYLEVLLAA